MLEASRESNRWARTKSLRHQQLPTERPPFCNSRFMMMFKKLKRIIGLRCQRRAGNQIGLCHVLLIGIGKLVAFF